MAKKKSEKFGADLEATLGLINKKFGSGSLIAMSQKLSYDAGVIHTGSRRLDKALGIGGWPYGRIIELYGPPSSGKTTLALHAIKAAQEDGKRVAFIDAEHALDIEWARKIGVDVDDLLVSQPDHGEQALEICDMLVQSNQVGLVVVDSVAALTPKDELEGEVGDHHVGKQARMMSQALRKIVASTRKHNVLVIFINQTRKKIGVMFGSPETTSGGEALKFYASIRAKVSRTGQNMNGDVAISSNVKVKVVKNKMSPPFTECEFVISFYCGIDGTQEILEDGVAAKLVKKGGAWLTYTDLQGTEWRWQGRNKALDELKSNPELLAEMASRVDPEVESGKPGDADEDEPEEEKSKKGKAKQTQSSEEAVADLLG